MRWGAGHINTQVQVCPYDTYQGLLNAEISGWEHVGQKARVTDNHNHEEESEKEVESWESSKFSRCTFLFLLGLSLFLLMFPYLVICLDLSFLSFISLLLYSITLS